MSRTYSYRSRNRGRSERSKYKRQKRASRRATNIRAKRDEKKKTKWRPMNLADVLYQNFDDLIGQKTQRIDATRCMIVATFKFGYVIECEIMENDLLERETLFSRDGKVWTLLGRKRHGPTHHDLKWYPRDTIYPIGCKVRI